VGGILEPMRDIRNGTCPLCEHDEIVEGVPGEFGGEGMEQPSAFTYDKRWLLSGRNPSHAHGLLSYFMCRRCGFLQWFVKDPGSVPIDEARQTRLLPKGSHTDGPFR
jgi:hypothetical protein